MSHSGSRLLLASRSARFSPCNVHACPEVGRDGIPLLDPGAVLNLIGAPPDSLNLSVWAISTELI